MGLPFSIRKSFNLLSFVSLSAIEKLLSIILVYLIAKTSDLETYNVLEYLISVSAVFYVVFELGISSYIFEELKRYGSRYIDKSISHREHGARIAGLLVISIPICYAFGAIDFIFLAVLIAFQVVQRVEQSIHRIVDRPAFPYILNNVLLVVQIALVWFAGISLLAVIIPRLLFLVFYLIRFFSWISLSDLRKYLLNIISYSWPLILNVFLITLMSNMLRIYGWRLLDTETMAGVNIVLRYSSILFLLNTSLSNSFRKSNYLITGSKEMLVNTRIYAVIFLALAALSYLFLILLSSNIDVIINMTNFQIAGILLFTFFSALASYSEVFLVSLGKVRSVPYTTLIGALMLAIGLLFFVNSLNGLISVMIISFIFISMLRIYVIKIA